MLGMRNREGRTLKPLRLRTCLRNFNPDDEDWRCQWTQENQGIQRHTAKSPELPCVRCQNRRDTVSFCKKQLVGMFGQRRPGARREMCLRRMMWPPKCSGARHRSCDVGYSFVMASGSKPVIQVQSCFYLASALFRSARPCSRWSLHHCRVLPKSYPGRLLLSVIRSCCGDAL